MVRKNKIVPDEPRPKKINKAKAIKVLKERLWDLAKNYCRRKWGNTCYTCGKKDLSGGNWHTSHAIPSCICPFELDYHWMNLRPACYFCNIHAGGNGFLFKYKLEQAHGINYVDHLLNMFNNPKIDKPTVEDYQKYIIFYEKLIAEL